VGSIKGDWRKLHNEEPLNLNFSLNTFNATKWGMRLANMWHAWEGGDKKCKQNC